MPLLTQRRFQNVLLVLLSIAGLCILAAPFFGAESEVSVLKALKTLWTDEGPGGNRAQDLDILVSLRLARIAMAFLAGAALALTGAVFQALLRNPLADPYTLGVASGGSLGAVLAIYIPFLSFQWGFFSSIQVTSFLGAAAAVGVIYLLSRSKTGVSSIGLLLVGVTIGFICSAAIMTVRYAASPDLLVEVDRWLMGGLDVTGWRPVWSALPFFIPGAVLLLIQARHFDQIALGEELAAARGCNVGRLQAVSFFAGSLLTASVVSSVGPIGFVGLIVPHALRRVIGADHRLLLPASFLGGGAFLVVCDTIARTISWQPPVGILTALLGGPFFLFLLVRSRGKWEGGGLG